MEKEIKIESLIRYQAVPVWIDDEGVKELVKDFEIEGQINPIIVRKFGAKFEIIDGHTRAQACKALKLKTIKAIVLDLDDLAASRMFYSLNELRKGKTAAHYLASWISRWLSMEQAGQLKGTWLQQRRLVAEDLQKQSKLDSWTRGPQRLSENAEFASLAMLHGFTTEQMGRREVNGKRGGLAIVKAFDRKKKQIEQAEKLGQISEAKAEAIAEKLEETAKEHAATDIDDDGQVAPEESAQAIIAMDKVMESVIPTPKPPARPRPIDAYAQRVRDKIRAFASELDSMLGLEFTRRIKWAPDDINTTREIAALDKELEFLENALPKMRAKLAKATAKSKLRSVK